MLTWLAGPPTLAGLVLAGCALYVAQRRETSAGVSLAVLLTAAAWWGLFYAVELSTSTNDLATRSLWGDVKYVGVCVLPPAWLAFSLQYTGRGQLIEPEGAGRDDGRAARRTDPADDPGHPRPRPLLPAGLGRREYCRS